MRAAGLVAGGQVEGALLVIAEGADSVADVVQNVVLSDVAIWLSKAAGQEVHAVGCAEWDLGTIGVDEIGALGGIHLLVLHRHCTSSDRVNGRRLAGLQVVPGIVADIIGAPRLVDAQKMNGAALVGKLNTEVVAIDGSRPVCDTVRVDFAAKNAN